MADPLPIWDAKKGLADGITAYDHQRKATGTILRSLETRLAGLILADPPGMGKTLAMLMAIKSASTETDGPCLIVAPPSCGPQWKKEIDTFFKPGEMPSHLLTDRTTSPLDLFRYKVIICSYTYLAAEKTAKAKYLNRLKEHRQGLRKECPKRPHLCLLSDIWKLDQVRKWGPFLCLDEAHCIKNMRGRAYGGIHALRHRFTSCIMMTATPLDNLWFDCAALFSLLFGHPFRKTRHVVRMFATPNWGSNHDQLLPPSVDYMARLQQFFDACTLRRPLEILASKLPKVTRMTVRFNLTSEDRRESDSAFSPYHASIHASKGQGGAPSEGHFGLLVRALQYAAHPGLTKIMKWERHQRLQAQTKSDGGNDEMLLSEEDEEVLERWREEMRKNENWRSKRIDTILNIVNTHRDASPDDAIVILDESVFFLDLVQMALQCMHEPLPVWQYDGRASPAERTIRLEEFNNGSGTRVLLASRGTAGLGLNIQAANVLIRCAPMWKKSWEDQADGREYRNGQTKPVFIYALVSDAMVEQHIIEKREQKSLTNDAIMEDITRKDDDMIIERRFE